MPGKRLIGLDVLRGISVIAVCLSHYDLFDPNQTAVKFFLDQGAFAVAIFFVLSGYLVGGMIFREYKATGALSLRNFFLNRFKRIYPLHYLLIIVTVILNATEYAYMRNLKLPYPMNVNAGAHPTKWQQVVGELTYTQSVWAKIQPQTWTLAIEEHFYFIAAFSMFMIAKYRKPARYLLYVFAVVCSVIFSILVVVKAALFPNMVAMCRTYDAVALGVVIAYVDTYVTSFNLRELCRRSRFLFIVAGLATTPLHYVKYATFLPGRTAGVADLIFTPWAHTLSACFLVLGAFGFRTSTPLSRGFEEVGKSCYAIYLFHWHVLNQFYLIHAKTRPFHGKNVLFGASFLFSALLFGHVLQKVYDRIVIRVTDALQRRVAPSGPCQTSKTGASEAASIGSSFTIQKKSFSGVSSASVSGSSCSASTTDQDPKSPLPSPSVSATVTSTSIVVVTKK